MSTTSTSVTSSVKGTAGIIDGKLVLSQGISRNLGTSGVAGQFDRIPVIDLSPLISESGDPEALDVLVSQLHDACTRVGFFVIKNHGIDWGIVERAFAATKEFFGLPMDIKMKLHQAQSPSLMGYEEPYYTNVDRLKKGDLKESMSTAYEPELDPEGLGNQPDLLRRQNIWPKESDAPLFKPAMREYRASCLSLTRRLMGLMAKAIGVDEHFFEKKATYPIATIRALYYPPQAPDDTESTGLGAHTDIQFMTLIAQDPYDMESLEVLNANGQWIQPKLEPQTFVVNLSDMMARLTNDVFQSTIHRVTNKTGRERYSLPFFFGLNNDELINTLPQFVTDKTPLREGYERAVTGYEHYNIRMQRAHHKHPVANKSFKLGLPEGMTKVDGVTVEGL